MYRRVLCGISILTCLFAIIQAGIHTVTTEENFEDRLANDLFLYVTTGNQTVFFKENLHKIQFPTIGRPKDINEIIKPNENIACIACRAAFKVILWLLKPRVETIELPERLISICTIFGIGEPIVCRKMIEFNLRAVLYIGRHSKGLSADFICGTVFQGTCVTTDQSRDWMVSVDKNGPEIKGHKTFSGSSEYSIRIAHISDTHYDPKYQEGANAACNFPLCCREDQGIPSNPNNAAGKWGDYRSCDMPWKSVQNVFDQIQNTHKNIDVVYMTGDFVDHAVWDTSFEVNKANIKNTTIAMRAAFPNVPLFPTIGNHEPHPLNLFSPDDIDDTKLKTTPMYEFIADTWHWLPESAKETIRFGGYYTAMVRSGLRVISLNSNLCNVHNFWNLYNTKYMEDHLQWLHDTLLLAENNHEKVHILAHMVSGEIDCVNNWGREYRRIIDRFWNTISAQFTGHTHKDEFNIFYSKEKPEYAINVAWNGGCATTFVNVNPNYRLYSVESETFQVTSHETWIYNLTEANLSNDTPHWYKEYIFEEEYNTPDLSPASLDQLVKRFAKDTNLLYDYWKNHVKRGDPYLNNGCHENCLASVLCKIVTTEFYDTSKCLELL